MAELVLAMERGQRRIRREDDLVIRIGADRGVGERVDLRQGRQDLLGQVDFARRQLAEVALLRPTTAEIDPAVGNGSRRADFSE